LDSQAIEEAGHDGKTAASWYHVTYKPVKLDKVMIGDQETINHGDLKLQLIHIPGHTPGSIVLFVEIGGYKVLFGQDIHGPFMESFGSNLYDYHRSMNKLIDLKADILCEGHYGIIRGKNQVQEFIESHMDANPV
jgi:glyoxylase-like metal-dependent hydrolase (beta-lactamase superfamily II)